MDQMAELVNRFHHILFEACNSKQLARLLVDFHEYVLRVRKKTLTNGGRGKVSNDEHRQIMEAIKAKDGERAQALAHEHMINAYDNMVKNGLYNIYSNEG